MLENQSETPGQSVQERKTGLEKQVEDLNRWIKGCGPHSKLGISYRRDLVQKQRALELIQIDPNEIGFDDTVNLLRLFPSERLGEIDRTLFTRIMEGKTHLPIIHSALDRLKVPSENLIHDLALLHEIIEPKLALSYSKEPELISSYPSAIRKGSFVQRLYREALLYNPETRRLYSSIIKDVLPPGLCKLTPVLKYVYDKNAPRRKNEPLPLPERQQEWNFRIIKGNLNEDDRLYFAALLLCYSKMTPDAKKLLYSV
jgi:hypothetical protein